jgi:hypothetical protein
VDKAVPSVVTCRKCLEKLIAEPLVHENIDQIYACFLHENYCWVVSELGEFGSAKTIMNATFPKNTGFDEETCLAILEQIALAVQVKFFCYYNFSTYVPAAVSAQESHLSSGHLCCQLSALSRRSL